MSALSPSPNPSALPEADDSLAMPSRKSRVSFGAYSMRAAALGYVLLMIVVPLAGIVLKAFSSGGASFTSAIAQPEAWDAIRLTLIFAAGITVFNAIMGTGIAWTLARFRFPGKSLLNVLIDLPFAIPTVVIGFMIVLLYGPQSVLGMFFGHHGVKILFAKPGIALSLLFVTLPFVARAVQPVLMELDPEVEQAAWTLGAGSWLTFRRVILPTLLPAILTGCGLSFTRALGEFGSVVLVAGNIPFRSQTAPVYIYGQIESDNPQGATAVSVFLLGISLAVTVLLYQVQRRQERHSRAA